MARPVKASDEDIIKAHAKGLSLSGIGKEVGLSPNNISVRLKKLGLRPNRLDVPSDRVIKQNSIKPKIFDKIVMIALKTGKLKCEVIEQAINQYYNKFKFDE